MRDDHFDFIKGFSGVDLLQVEAISGIVGHATGALMKGMIEAGLSEEAAHRVIRTAIVEMLRVALTMPLPKQQ